MVASNAKIVQLWAPTAQTNSATTTARLDCVGADYVTIVLNCAIELNTNAVGPTLSLLSCDNTTVTNFATIVADRSAEDLVAAKDVVYHVDMRSQKRYLRLTLTSATATNDNVTSAAVAILTRLDEAPSSTSEMVGSTNDAVVVV